MNGGMRYRFCLWQWDCMDRYRATHTWQTLKRCSVPQQLCTRTLGGEMMVACLHVKSVIC